MRAPRVIALTLLLLSSTAAPALAEPGWQTPVVPTLYYDIPIDFRFLANATGEGLLGMKLRDAVTGYDEIRAARVVGNGVQLMSSITTATGAIESWDMTLQPNADQPVAVAWSTPSPSYSVRLGVWDVSDDDWSVYTMATSTQQITSVRVFAAGNETLVVWMNYSVPYSLQSRMRNSIGVLGTVDYFDLTSDSIGGFSGGSSAAGIVTVVWDQVWGGPKEVVARSYFPGSGWQTFTAATVGAPEWTNSTPLAVVDPGGNVTAFWLQVNATGTDYFSTTFRSNSTGTQPVEHLDSIPAGDNFGAMHLQYRDGAGVGAAWYVSVSGQGPQVRTALRPPGGPWSAPRAITPPPASSFRDFSLNGSGGAALAYTQSVGNLYDHWIVRVPASGGQRAPERPPLVFVTTLESDPIKVFARPNGNISVAWLERRIDRNELVVRVFSPDDAPPALSISSPAEGAVVKVPTTVVAGVTEPNVTLTVGPLSVMVEADGSFSVPFALFNGTNMIEVRALDAFGNVAAATVNVTFVDPTAALEAQLAALDARASAVDVNLTSLRADLAAASANLSAAQADVAQATAALTAAQGDLAVLADRLNATDAALAFATSNLTDAEAILAALETSGNASAEEIEAARANATAARDQVNALAAAQAANLADLQRASANATAAAALLVDAGARLNASAANITALELSVQLLASRLGTLESQGTTGAGRPDNTLAMLAVVLALVAAALAGVSLMRGTRMKKSAAPPLDGPPPEAPDSK